MPEIIIQTEAPPLLVQLVNEAYEGIESVKKVVFTAFELQDKALGVFIPLIETVYIDLGHCMVQKEWMAKGATFVANVWMNMLFVIHHELIHACQIMDHPELMELSEVPQEYEDEANELAKEAMYSWFEAGGKVPSLRELGWVGEMIGKTFNDLLSQKPDEIMLEMDALTAGAIAKADVVVATHDHFNDIPLLYQLIDEGKVGVKVNGQRFLTATEFLEA
jgi:hypothetical protein